MRLSLSLSLYLSISLSLSLTKKNSKPASNNTTANAICQREEAHHCAPLREDEDEANSKRYWTRSAGQRRNNATRTVLLQPRPHAHQTTSERDRN